MTTKSFNLSALLLAAATLVPTSAFADGPRHGQGRAARSTEQGQVQAQGRAVQRDARQAASPQVVEAPRVVQAPRTAAVPRTGNAPGAIVGPRAAVVPGVVGPRAVGPRAVPRVAPRVVAPVVVAPRYYPYPYYGPAYRPYYYPPAYRPYYYPAAFSPYPFRPWFNLTFGLSAGYPVAYYAYPYPVPVYGVGAPYNGSVTVGPGTTSYGGVALQITPGDASVYVDGAYAGFARDFDGSRQPLSLTPGTHHLEVTLNGFQTLAFDVTVQPGMVIPYQGSLRPY